MARYMIRPDVYEAIQVEAGPAGRDAFARWTIAVGLEDYLVQENGNVSFNAAHYGECRTARPGDWIIREPVGSAGPPRFNCLDAATFAWNFRPYPDDPVPG